MAKKKVHDKNKYLQMLLIILASILIVLVVLVIRNKRVEKMQDLAREKIDMQQMLIDNENDGVFTNQQLGFSFQYPQETFVSQDQTTYYDLKDYSYMRWSTSESTQLQSETDVSLSVNWNTDGTIHDDEAFEILSGLAIGASRKINSTENETLLSKRLVGSAEFVTVYYRSGESSRPEFTYSLLVKEENRPLIRISMSGDKESRVKSYKKIFDDVVKSFEFTQ